MIIINTRDLVVPTREQILDVSKKYIVCQQISVILYRKQILGDFK